MPRLRLAFVAAALVATACGVATPADRAVPRPGDRPAAHGVATYQNPLLAQDFADPCVIHAADGRYYAYATQARVGAAVHDIGCAVSDDLVHWQRLPDALPAKPAWAHTTQNFWAPHVVRQRNRYLMYFAAQADRPVGETGFAMGLGVAIASSPAGPFQPLADPMLVEPDFMAIDAFVADGYLVWGSCYQPLRARKLAPDGLAFAPGSQEKPILAPRPLDFEHLIEGAWIQRRDGWYYLFYSGDDCCLDIPGLGEPTYAVMVARSRSLLGPYERRTRPDGTADPILHRNDRWLAPGHNAVITDAAGTDWLFYHAIDALQRTTPGTNDLRRCLLMDPLRYEDGWPRVAGDTPSTTLLPVPTR